MIKETKLTAEERYIASKIDRRGFMGKGVTAAAMLASLIGVEPEMVRAATPNAATADSIIVLWMGGGMASTETFDPKRYTPFAPGVRTDKVLSTSPAIDTSVDNIKISQGLERVAKVMDRGSLIRSFQAADLGFILHSRHQFHWHTGYVPPQPMAVPHIGAVIAKTLGPRVDTVPPFISIGQNLEIGSESPALKSFQTGGFLGSEYGPVLLADPQDAASAVRPPSDLGSARFTSRRKTLREGSRETARLSVRRRLPAGESAAFHGCGGQIADVALREGIRYFARSKREVRYLQYKPFRSGLFVGTPPRGSRRALCGGHHRVCAVPLVGQPPGRTIPAR